ncbi:FlaA1/EpsC-like NDP-sugar epimerase [Oikeobacillus pervagus]|uniref:FlaA1/EpsC-like NDP-sugar epimerase n=1 Tax=Oikeobacillus pervagus TaxID=1325931 RepID=A0AAJ1T0Z3_9BACI|nr:cytochrome c class I [Oikeobacillus pervagus]MDQ0216284.1 FlaA1/EpsC-like NDP-sugar epimerase [Oikeobacillus pervagus]
MIVAQALPIPNDIQLPIPGDMGLLTVLIIVTFLLHIIFVNMTVSLATGAVIFEAIGMWKKRKIYDRIAQICSYHASIHKSIAVVIGVGPLLLVSILYTQYFYSSTILIGKAWLSIILLLIIAFLLLYAYKFLWEKLANKKGLHITIGLMASLILLFVPLIFIVNVVSMLYPEKWMEANGFFHGLFYYPQIWQRYLHFMLASFAAGGLYLYLFYTFKFRFRKKKVADYQESEADQLTRKMGIKATFWITIAQFASGAFVLFALKRDVLLLYMGDDLLATGLLLASIVFTFLLLGFLYVADRKDSYRAFMGALASFILVLGLMGWMRHEVREAYIQPHIDDHPRTMEHEA